MKHKIVFNQETLSFEYSKFSIKNFIKKSLVNVLIAGGIGGFLGYSAFNSTITPKMKTLQQENTRLVSQFRELDQNLDIQLRKLKKLENTDDYTYRPVLGLSPIPQATRILGYGGGAQFPEYTYQGNAKIVKDVSKKTFSINNRIKLEAKSYEKIIHMIKSRDKMINSIPSICPLAKKDLKRIGSGFGYRMHPILHVIKLHTGVDLSANTGKPVYATGDGIVTRADYSSGGYGKIVQINHGYSYSTYYAHLSKILVSAGQMVKRGQLIGLIGSTGRSTGPHLHYEVRINGKPVNPLNFFYSDIDERQYEMMIRQAATGQSVEPM